MEVDLEDTHSVYEDDAKVSPATHLLQQKLLVQQAAAKVAHKVQSESIVPKSKYGAAGNRTLQSARVERPQVVPLSARYLTDHQLRSLTPFQIGSLSQEQIQRRRILMAEACVER